MVHFRTLSAFADSLQTLSPTDDNYVPNIVRLILAAARTARASDVHLVPTESTLMMQWRVDGVLHSVAGFDREIGMRIITRLKVVSGLLTYRTDIPQEGRVAREHSVEEVRVATFPTLHGEKAAVRLFAAQDQLQRLENLGLPQAAADELANHLRASSGVILLTGPSGSGKTTTAYACLREVLAESSGARCVMTLEDPIEVAVDGATQSQIRASAGFDLATGVKSLMRQDPDVILVGEIRDPPTAEAVFLAALTGHLVLTTIHAGSAAEAVTRLLEMKVEPYLLRSGLRSVVCQRLLRRSVNSGASGSQNPGMADKIQSPEVLSGLADGREFQGRFVIAEVFDPNHPKIAAAILAQVDAVELQNVASLAGMATLREVADAAVAAGVTTRDEIFRVLGRENANA